MMNAAQRHWQTFATLYDPDAPIHPDRQLQGQPKFLAMTLGSTAYPKYRKRLLKRNPVCFYCGTEVNNDSSSLDHIIPECRGGEDTPGNLQLSCLNCNGSKGDATPVEWLADLEAKIEQLTKQAAKLAEVIEAESLDTYRPAVARHQGKKGKAGHPSGPVEMPPSWNIPKCDFRNGRTRYDIIHSATNKVLIRGLKLQDAVHYLLAVGPDDSVGLVAVMPMYHEALGLVPVAYESGDVESCQ